MQAARWAEIHTYPEQRGVVSFEYQGSSGLCVLPLSSGGSLGM